MSILLVELSDALFTVNQCVSMKYNVVSLSNQQCVFRWVSSEHNIPAMTAASLASCILVTWGWIQTFLRADVKASIERIVTFYKWTGHLDTTRHNDWLGNGVMGQVQTSLYQGHPLLTSGDRTAGGASVRNYIVKMGSLLHQVQWGDVPRVQRGGGAWNCVRQIPQGEGRVGEGLCQEHEKTSDKIHG